MTKRRRLSDEELARGIWISRRPVPDPIMIALRRNFPRLVHAEIEGENDIYLLIADKRGRPHHAVHYVASPSFMTAVRVAESGLNNLLMLVEKGDFKIELLAPAQDQGGGDNA
jgi:hypothetical protein